MQAYEHACEREDVECISGEALTEYFRLQEEKRQEVYLGMVCAAYRSVTVACVRFAI